MLGILLGVFMSIIITMMKSEREYIAGIPEYIELSTDIPSTIFFTTDGSVPDSDSEIYIDKIYISGYGPSLSLSVLAVSDDLESGEFSHYFSTDQSGLDGRRLVGSEGINVLRIGEPVVGNLSVGLDGYATQETSIEFSDLDIKTSRYSRAGESIPDGTTVEFVNFPAKEGDDPGVFQGRSSSINDNAYFDPTAGVIYIDGSSQELLDQQEVRIINRPQGTISAFGSNYNDHIMQAPPLTGNLVRSMYNPKTGIYVSYYYESKECRWIQSTQRVKPGIRLDISKISRVKHKFVYKWITARHMSKIY